MIILRTDKPIPDRPDVWPAEINVKELTPARRDKLVTLLTLSGFALRTGATEMKTGEIREIDSLWKMENGV